MSAAELAGFAHEFRPAASADAPALLLLHGTGGDERQLLDVGRLLAPDAALLAPRGRVVEGDGAPRFFRRIPTGAATAYPFTFDRAEVVQQAGELAGFVAEAAAHYGLDGRPLVAVGFSNGANMAGVMLLTHPALLRGAVLAAPMPILDPAPPADLAAAAALLSGGRHDPIATPPGVEALAADLADRGAAVQVHWHDGGHELTRGTVEAARTWLATLRKVTATDPLP